MLEILDFFGVNSRCLTRAYVWRKNESTPTTALVPTVPTQLHNWSFLLLHSFPTLRFEGGMTHPPTNSVTWYMVKSKVLLCSKVHFGPRRENTRLCCMRTVQKVAGQPKHLRIRYREGMYKNSQNISLQKHFNILVRLYS